MRSRSLAFARLNLRWNPFGEPGPDDIVRLAVVEVEQYVERLRTPGFAVQYLGEAGRGKSTHLLALHHYFPSMPYVKFQEDDPIPDIPHAPVLFLDETQRLPSDLRRRVFARDASFAVGTHEDHSAELSRAGVESVSVSLKGMNSEHLSRIINRRIEWARREPGPVPSLPTSDLTGLIQRYGDDLSAILAHLYDEFQSMEEVGSDQAPGGV